MPPFPPGEGFPPPPPPIPAQQAQPAPLPVLRSFQLWVASVVISVIGAGLAVVSWGGQKEQVVQEFLDAARSGGTEVTREQAETFATAVFVGTIGITLALTLFLLFLAFRMRAGRNWARIVLTVVGGATALFGIAGVAAGGATAISSVLQSGLMIAAIVFMYLGASSAYFSKRARY